MLLRPKKHWQFLIHYLFKSDGCYTSPLHLTLRFNQQLPISLCQQVQLLFSFFLIWFEVEMLLVGVGEEEVAEERCVEEGLEDSIDVASVADVVQTREVLRDDFISV